MRIERIGGSLALAMIVGCAVPALKPAGSSGGLGTRVPADVHTLAADQLNAVGAEGFRLLQAHPRVEDRVAHLLQRRQSLLDTSLGRASRYVEMIQKELERERVPADLAFLPLVESGFREDVYGLGGAGLWQLSGSTARRYGLSVARRHDERRDPVKSSRAAARYLRDLYDEFGKWDLALAAYNAGPGRVKRALERMPKASFWELSDRRLLPNVTRQFVPHVLASGLVGRELVS